MSGQSYVDGLASIIKRVVASVFFLCAVMLNAVISISTQYLDFSILSDPVEFRGARA